MKNIKAIIFDLGGVILNINYQNTITEFKKLGLKNIDLIYSQEKQSNLFNQIETGIISDMDFLLELKKKTAASSITQIKTAWNAMLLDLPEIRINLIKNLKSTFKIYLLSNTNNIHVKKLKKILGKKKYEKFYTSFDKIYYSHKIGVRKPNAKSFQLILDENGLMAEDVLFIDDSLQHILKAKKLGLETHYLKNEDIITVFPDITL